MARHTRCKYVVRSWWAQERIRGYKTDKRPEVGDPLHVGKLNWTSILVCFTGQQALLLPGDRVRITGYRSNHFRKVWNLKPLSVRATVVITANGQALHVDDGPIIPIRRLTKHLEITVLEINEDEVSEGRHIELEAIS